MARPVTYYLLIGCAIGTAVASIYVASTGLPGTATPADRNAILAAWTLSTTGLPRDLWPPIPDLARRPANWLVLGIAASGIVSSCVLAAGATALRLLASLSADRSESSPAVDRVAAERMQQAEIARARVEPQIFGGRS